jgi:glycosyltransferase involved in cell wall biosynthesis
LIETLNVGGAENLAVRIANAMAGAGHESHLIVITEAGELKRFVAKDVQVHELGFVRESAARPLRFARSIQAGFSLLADVVRRHDINVIQTHLPGANFWGLLLAMRGRVAVVPTVHNNREFSYGDSDNPLRARARRLAYAALVRRSAAMVAVSGEVKASLRRDLGLSARASERIVVVRNGVQIPEIADLPSRALLRAEFALSEHEFTFLAAGRHCEQKNFGDLIRAAAMLAGEHRAWKLVIAGDGPDRPQLESMVADAKLETVIVFPGNVMDMQGLMVAADAFVMSSLWEGLPLVLLEAMAVGLPIVGNRIAGIEGIVGHEVEGLLVDPGDPRSLAAGMCRLLNEPESCRRLGTAARERVVREFNFETTVAGLQDLYSICTTNT